MTRRPSRVLPLRLCYFLFSALIVNSTSEPSFEEIKLGEVVAGSTVGKVQYFQSNQIPSAPQALYFFSVPSKSGATGKSADISLSTCVPSHLATIFGTFSASIYIFEPLNTSSVANATSEVLVATSEKDCGDHTTVEFRAATDKRYLVVITSTTGQSGRFRLVTNILALPPTPTPLPWGLDRIDQRHLPLDNRYSVGALNDSMVYVYVLDSGVRVTHSEFNQSNGMRNAFHGIDVVERLNYAKDCTGHGTHVAGVIAGKSFGVAKNAVIISVRVLGCDGNGFVTRLMEGLQFVMDESSKQNNLRRPAVVSMSLSTGKSEALNKAVRRLSQSGIAVVTAAGNDDQDSCMFSPASEETAITVAASNTDDTRPTFSNSGNCVDIFAPGQDILSSWHTGDNAARVQSGTSFACPHVAGAVAVLLSVNPSLPSNAVANIIYSASTTNTVGNHSEISGNASTVVENNRLVYVRPIPSKGFDSPSTGFLYIYAILSVQISPGTTASLDECTKSSRTTQYLEDVGKRMAAELSISNSESAVNVTLCCPNDEDAPQCGRSSSYPLLKICVGQKETLASTTFDQLETFLRNDKGMNDIAQILRVTSLSIEVEPWVVDSDGNVFWTAPDLRIDDRRRFTTVAAIVVAVFSTALIIGVTTVTYVVKKHKTEKKERSAYELALAEHKRKKKEQEAIHSLKLWDGLQSPRETIPRENSALKDEVLCNLPSTASLRTPSVFPVGASPFSGSRKTAKFSSRTRSFFKSLRTNDTFSRNWTGDTARSQEENGEDIASADRAGSPSPPSVLARTLRMLSFDAKTHEAKSTREPESSAEQSGPVTPQDIPCPERTESPAGANADQCEQKSP